MSDTRFREVKREEIGGQLSKLIYDTDQFVWYRDAKGRCLKDRDSAYNLMSAIRFQLPLVPGKMSPSYLMVVGDGLEVCNVYLTRVQGRDFGTGMMPPQDSFCSELFSYSKARKEKGVNPKQLRELEGTIPAHFINIFTTDIAPFLKSGDLPLECDRIYNIMPSCIGSDMIKIVAENRRKDLQQQRLRVIWHPDSRDAKPKEIISIPNLEWSTGDFSFLPRTDRFSFQDTRNAI